MNRVGFSVRGVRFKLEIESNSIARRLVDVLREYGELIESNPWSKSGRRYDKDYFSEFNLPAGLFVFDSKGIKSVKANLIEFKGRAITVSMKRNSADEAFALIVIRTVEMFQDAELKNISFEV